MEFAYASAYAEFMERLQNNVLISNTYFFSKYFSKECSFNRYLKVNGLKLDFVYDPQEEVTDVEKVLVENEGVLTKLFSFDNKEQFRNYIINTLEYKKLICVPFYDECNDQIIKLPIDLLLQCTGTTGMCAGNTPEEALVQGLSELLERYAIKQIYYNRITPPIIPTEYFKDYSIYEKIQNIESRGLKVIIKDFSIGKQLPVIGVIIIDPVNRKFNVKVGSDPWPITALERCLTELYQSLDGIRLIDKNDYGEFEKLDQNHLFTNLTKIMNNSTGQWPDSIFFDDFSYKFDRLDFSHGKSNASDLQFLVQLIRNLGFNIYIRDVSYLGFYSYYIVAPGLSNDRRGEQDHNVFYDLFCACGDLINHLSFLPDDKIDKISQVLESYYDIFKNGFVSFEKICFNNVDKDIKNISIDLLLSMIFYRLRNIDKSYYYMNLFLKQKPSQDFLYFYACKDYLALQRQKENSTRTISYLEKIYGIDLTQEIIEDMKDPRNIFKSYNLQSFFDCENCNIEDFPYVKFAPILKRIRNMQTNFNLSQSVLSKVFKQ
jgi:ribosomal protein S12 methylthiotransferase accessory factor